MDVTSQKEKNDILQKDVVSSFVDIAMKSKQIKELHHKKNILEKNVVELAVDASLKNKKLRELEKQLENGAECYLKKTHDEEMSKKEDAESKVGDRLRDGKDAGLVEMESSKGKETDLQIPHFTKEVMDLQLADGVKQKGGGEMEAESSNVMETKKLETSNLADEAMELQHGNRLLGGKDVGLVEVKSSKVKEIEEPEIRHFTKEVMDLPLAEGLDKDVINMDGITTVSGKRSCEIELIDFGQIAKELQTGKGRVVRKEKELVKELSSRTKRNTKKKVSGIKQEKQTLKQTSVDRHCSETDGLVGNYFKQKINCVLWNTKNRISLAKIFT